MVFRDEAIVFEGMQTHPDRNQPPVIIHSTPNRHAMPGRCAGPGSQTDSQLPTGNQGDDFPVDCSAYLLVCEARSTTLNQGRWQFTLETADGEPVFDAADDELGDLNRLTLLAAVRGLESIEGPAAVTLLSHNRYLIRSLTDSLPRWRESDFVWEHFGRRIDVQNADLWRRIDGALAIHRVEACLISSRLISSGLAGPAKPSAGITDQPQPTDQQGRFSLRVDSPHPQPPPPAMRSAPKDRLRRWLLAGVGDSASPPKHRFTSADLVGTA